MLAACALPTAALTCICRCALRCAAAAGCLASVACRKVAEYQQSCAARVSKQLQRSRVGRLATVLQAWAAVAGHRHAVQQRLLHVVLRITLLKVSAAFTQWRERTAESAGQHAWAWQLHPQSFTESCLQKLYIVQDAVHLKTSTKFSGFAVAQVTRPDDIDDCSACSCKTGAGHQRACRLQPDAALATGALHAELAGSRKELQRWPAAPRPDCQAPADKSVSFNQESGFRT